ncbi:MAG TPA: LysM peptidoglycan-binding domain-containing protein, partial [Leptolinea sp.]
MDVNQRIKSSGKRSVYIVILSLYLLTSCAPAYSSPIDLTATALTRNFGVTQSAVAPTKAAKSMGSDGLHDSIPVSTSTPIFPAPTLTVAEIPIASDVPVIPTVAATPRPTRTSLPSQSLPTINTQKTSETTVPLKKPTLTATPATTIVSMITPTSENNNSQKMVLYNSQAGDTRSAIAVRFGVPVFDITSSQDIPTTGLLNPNQLLVIPNHLGETGPGGILMPDSEVVYSPSALDLDIDKFVNDSGGYLSNYRQYLSSGWHTGAEVIQRVAIENSINPRLLLSLLEYRSHWVTGQPASPLEIEYPISHSAMPTQGLYHQLSWAVQQFSIGYYGWRAGLITTLQFPDGTTLRMAPELNAGTVAVQYLFSKIENKEKWGASLYSPGN